MTKFKLMHMEFFSKIKIMIVNSLNYFLNKIYAHIFVKLLHSWIHKILYMILKNEHGVYFNIGQLWNKISV